jgi:hypothetical protein
MISLKEKQKLDEMAFLVVSSTKDGRLPFRIAVKSPDHNPPHARILDLKTGKQELGQFLISSKAPRKLNDIKDYKQGITDDMRKQILDWADRSCGVLPEITNWESLLYTWQFNEIH